MIEPHSEKRSNHSPTLVQEVISEWERFKTPIYFEVETDAEWWYPTRTSGNHYICLTYRIWEDDAPTVFLEHPEWRKDGNRQYNPTWEGETPLPLILGVSEVKPIGKPKKPFRKLVVYFNFFFSEGDIRAFWGERLSDEIWRHTHRQGRILTISDQYHQYINLDYYLEYGGVIRQVCIRPIDHSGYKTGGLEKVAEKSNIEMPYKGWMDDFKSEMDVAYKNDATRPRFVKYAEGDCILFEVYKKYIKSNNRIREIIGLQPTDRPGMRKGSNVAKMLMECIEQFTQLTWDDVKPYGIRQEDCSNYDTPTSELLSQFDVETISQAEKEWTKRYLAITMGGRCKNESPHNPIAYGLVASFDVSSAYSTALMQAEVPLGIPTIVEFSESSPEDWLTLEQFLKKYESRLVPGLWHAVIDTCGNLLSFHQNIFFSKDIPPRTNIRQTDDYDEFDEEGHFKGEFLLATREILNGILTHHSLQTVRAVATKKEWGEFQRKVKVKAAMFYEKQRYKPTVEEWKTELSNAKGKLSAGTYKDGGNFREDLRPRVWTTYPLKNFMLPTFNERKRVKKQRSDFTYNSPQYKLYDAIQDDLKESNNTVYGVIASPYFPISNPTLSNNITDIVRMTCWAMAMCGNAKTSITDGCELELNNVVTWEEYRPGLNTLATITRPYNYSPDVARSIKRIPLGGSKWEFKGESRKVEVDGQKFTEYAIHHNSATFWGREGVWSYVDEEFTIHLKSFFKGLKLDWLNLFSFETKDIYKGMVAHSQANYLVEKLDGELDIKARGYTKSKVNYNANTHEELNEPTIKTMLREIYDSHEAHPQPPSYVMNPVKLSKYQNEKNLDSELARLGLKPGDQFMDKAHAKAISASMFIYPTTTVRRAWVKHYQKLSELGWGLEGDYIDEEGKVDYLLAAADIQRRIDDGKNPKGYRQSPKMENPFKTDES